MPRSIMLVGTTTLACWLAQPVAAATYDGSQPLTCAPVNIVSCSPGDECQPETAEAVNLPRFLKFDFSQKQITGMRPNGAALTTTMGELRRVADNLVLQGTEGKFMWSVMIGATNGDLTLTVGGDQVGFLVFGACTQG